MNLRDTPAIDQALTERLSEWGRWARQRRWLSFCRSIEGRFRPEAGDVWETEPRSLPVDALDAWHVECCWRTGLPLRERLILRAHFVIVRDWQGYRRRLSRQLGIPRKDWDHALVAAANMLNNILRREDKRRILARKQCPRLAVDACPATAPMRSSSIPGRA